MPYPFSKMPSYSQLRKTLENDHSCFFKTVEVGSLTGAYFERMNGEKKLQCPVSFEDENEMLSPNTLGYIVRRLELDPEVFGFTLGN